MADASPPAAVVIAPPWSAGGSTNLFSAQIKAYADSGRRVLLLLGPTNKWQSSANRDFWGTILPRMAFPGAAQVAYARIRPPGLLEQVLQRFDAKAKVESPLLRIARMGAEASLPQDVISFVDQNDVDIVHVNHAFEVLLGDNLARMIEQRSGRKPAIVCETHDIQSVALARHASEHRAIRDADTTDEENLYRRADYLLHCASDDLAFFESRLPASRHYLHLPTIRATTEAALRDLPAETEAGTFDFLYIGDEHVSNFKSLAWLMRKVMPLVGAKSDLVCVGRIANMVRQEDPRLYAAFRSSFRGQVEDIISFYRRARAVVVPSFEGTGTSIKLVEALCSGKPIVATGNALRGLPPGCSSQCLFKADTPEEFATAMREALRLDGQGCASVNRSIYETYFSNAAYSRRMAEFIEIFERHGRTPTP